MQGEVFNWARNGETVYTYPSAYTPNYNVSSYNGNFSLIINNFEIEDEGNYTCGNKNFETSAAEALYAVGKSYILY